MKTLSSAELRENLASVMDQVTDDHEPVIVTRAGAKPVVMLSLEDYDAMDETAYLLSSPNNARRLLKAVDGLRAGRGVARDLIEE